MPDDQLVFPGFDEPGQKTDRLFFAIYPDPDAAILIARRAAALRDEWGLTGKPLETARFHITLQHLGDFAALPQDLIVKAVEAAESVVAAPFDVVFDRAVSFGTRPGNNPFVLRGGDGLARPDGVSGCTGRGDEKDRTPAWGAGGNQFYAARDLALRRRSRR